MEQTIDILALNNLMYSEHDNHNILSVFLIFSHEVASVLATLFL